MHTSNLAPNIYRGPKWPHFLSVRNAVGRGNRFCVFYSNSREKKHSEILGYAHFVRSA